MDHLTIAQEKEFDSVFGKVTCKIPSLKQRLEISKRTQGYGNSSPISVVDWDLADAFGLLDVVITIPPSEFAKDEKTGGWDYDKLYDVDGLLELSKEVKAWIDSFRTGIRDKQTEVGA
jgi:hypothetical protein